MNYPMPEDIVMPGEEPEGDDWDWCSDCYASYRPDGLHSILNHR